MSTRTHVWWPRAELRRDEELDLDRKVSWLELFFDLVFVVVLARLAHDLAHHPDGKHVVDFVLLFAAVFWSWNAFTYYIERFESGGVEQRFFVFTAMATVGALAVWTEGGLGAHYTGFAWAYIAVRSVNMVQWIRAAIHVLDFRPTAIRFVGGFLIAAALLVLAIDLDGDTRRLVFAAAVLIDVLTPVVTLKQQSTLPRLSTSKFPERFGLFTILVLGESIVGVIVGVSEINEAGHLGVGQIVDGGFGLFIGVGLWWIYFDFIARRPPKPSLGPTLTWVYLHLLTLAAITATGAAISLAISESVEHGLEGAVRHLLTSAVAAAVAGMAALELTLYRAVGEPTQPIISPAIKAAVAAGILLLGWFDLGWSTTVLLAALVAALAIPAVYGAVVWYSPTNPQRPGTAYPHPEPPTTSHRPPVQGNAP